MLSYYSTPPTELFLKFFILKILQIIKNYWKWKFIIIIIIW